MDIYYILLFNIYTSITFIIFVDYFGKINQLKAKRLLNIVYLTYHIVYAFLPDTLFLVSVSVIINFVYIFLLQKRFISSLFLMLKFYMFFYTINAVSYTLHTLFFQDILLQNTTPAYFSFTVVSRAEVLFVILSLYICHKKISAFPNGRKYSALFFLIASVSVVSLTFSALLLGSDLFPDDQVVLILFSFLTIIVALSLTIFRKVTDIVAENTLHKIQLEKAQLEKQYAAQLNDNLTLIHSLRHDMKNHLLIIDGYTTNNEPEKVHEYINRINHSLVQTKSIDTPSVLVSSILNAKLSICTAKHITMDTRLDFPAIYIDDYSLITILGNLLDNAITAAAKVQNGHIDLDLLQSDAYLSIACTNNHNEEVRTKDGYFISSKSDKSIPHGIGLRNVMDSVKKCNGTIDIHYDRKTFTVTILIPNHIAS